jgi:hypothetical protein
MPYSVSFQRNARNKARRANAGYAAIERDANKDSKRARRVNADCATTERDARKNAKRARRANADYSAAE